MSDARDDARDLDPSRALDPADDLDPSRALDPADDLDPSRALDPADDLDPAARSTLLDAAEHAIEAQLLGRAAPLPSRAVHRPSLDSRLLAPGATFVTLLDDHRLLGCIGSMEPHRPLVDDVAANAVAAAFSDPRLPALTPDEFVHMTVKISVLSPLEPFPVADFDDLRARVRPGVDGLLVVAGRARATFLPSVWEQLPHVDDFLDHLWRKAGLALRAWPPGTTIERYTTTEFGRHGPRPLGA